MSGTTISSKFFGMSIESYDYNYAYKGGSVEAWPTLPVSVVRSWDVWSPNNSQIEYLDWNSLNPASGVYNWTSLNTWIAANQAQNAPMVYTFGNPPAWAGGTTTNLAAFQAFVTAIVTQANGGIKYWEGFNEFNVSGISPALVAQMQGIIYNTVHTLDPGALVLSPTVNTAGADSQFAQFLAAGGGNYFDIAAFHGYNNSTGEGIVPVVQDFQAVLAQYGLSNVPIWDTEWGMEAPTVITDTTAQEAYVSTGLILQAATGVQTEMFYAYDNANSALYNTATSQLTAAGVAYEETAQWLNGATLPSGFQVSGSVYTAQLVKNGQSDLLVWNASGQSSFAAGVYTQYVDTQGVVHTIANGTVTIGTVPILLETPSTTVPPSAPSITSVSPDSGTAGDGITNATTLTLTGAGAANSTVTVFDGSSQLGTAAVDASGAWSFVTATLVSGSHSFTATDTVGGAASAASSAVTVTIDTTTPSATSVVATGSGITNGTGDLNAGHVVTLTLGLSEAVTVANGTPTLTLNDGATATYTGGSGTNALTFNYTVAAGQNTTGLAVTAVNLGSATITDVAGNAANLADAVTTLSGILQIDTTPPAAPIITGDVVNTNNSVTVGGTAAANSTITVYDGSALLGTTAANATGAWSYTTGTLANGAVIFTATASDAAGNTSAVSTAVDPVIGALTGILSKINSIANGTSLSITGTVDNTGSIALNASGKGADLAVVGATSLTGSGSVTLSNNVGNVISSNGSAATLTNVNNTISGAGTIGDRFLTLSNQGTINANTTSALVIGTGNNTVTNSGMLEATSTGGLDIDTNVSNSRIIEAVGTNAKVVVQGVVVTDSSLGMILASGSGAQVDLSNATITGGTLQTSGRNALIETVAGMSTLNGVAISSGSTIEINSGTILTTNSAVTNSGTILVNGGTLDVAGTLSGGVTDIGGVGTMTIAQSSSENVTFRGSSASKLVLDQAPTYTGQISGFGTTQSVDLADINFSASLRMSYASSNWFNDSGTLTITQGVNTVRLHMDGSYTLANFHVANDGNGHTLLTDPSVVTQRPGNAAQTIHDSTVLEINTGDSGNVTFAANNGTLWLDQPATFTGKVSGLAAQNGIDLSTIAFGASTTLGYSPNNNNTGGNLTVTNGSQQASIALLGSYMASSFVMESDNHGGTMILADAAQTANQSVLTNPHHG